MSSEDIVNTHDSFMKSLGIELSYDDKRLPYLYWTPKLHKSPVKHCFISGSCKCTTKQLSSLLTKIFTVIKTGPGKYCSIKTSHTEVYVGMAGIPMRTNCAHYFAYLFPYSYENESLDKRIKEGKRKLARKFSLSYCYIDDLISFKNKRFKKFVSDIYLKELTISETTDSTSVAFHLYLLFTRDKNNNITQLGKSDGTESFQFGSQRLATAVHHTRSNAGVECKTH